MMKTIKVFYPGLLNRHLVKTLFKRTLRDTADEFSSDSDVDNLEDRDDRFKVEAHGHADDLEYLEKIIKERKLKMKKLNSKPNIFWRCIKAVFMIFFRGFFNFFFLTPIDGKKYIREDDEDYDKDGKRKNEQNHPPSPDWPAVVECILTSIRVGLEKYRKIDLFDQSGQKFKMSWTVDNITVLFSKVAELYGFIALAFKSEVGWSWSSSADQAIQNSNGRPAGSSGYYIYIYWGCVFLSIVFFSLIFPAAKRARKGTLGQASDGTQAKFTNKEFWIAKIMNILGGAAYLAVITNLIEILACDFDSDPWTLYATDSIQCYNAKHFVYLIVTIIAVLLYYPLATLMFPNLQFSNRMVDVKFTPSFVVLISQTKLFIAGIAVFVRNRQSVATRLSVSSALFLFLWYANYKMKPCVVVSTNLWFGAGYFLAFWINLCAIIVPTLHSDITALSLMAVGTVATAAVTVFMHIRRNKSDSKKRKKRSYK